MPNDINSVAAQGKNISAGQKTISYATSLNLYRHYFKEFGLELLIALPFFSNPQTAHA